MNKKDEWGGAMVHHECGSVQLLLIMMEFLLAKCFPSNHQPVKALLSFSSPGRTTLREERRGNYVNDL